MSNANLGLALVEEYRDLMRREKTMSESAEILRYYVDWLFRFCEKNGIEIPDRERLGQANIRLNELLEEFYRENAPTQRGGRITLNATPEQNTPFPQQNTDDPQKGYNRSGSNLAWWMSSAKGTS